MKLLLISDTHFGNHQDFAKYDNRGLNSRFILQLVAFNQALERGLKNGCEAVVHLGDVFHKRGTIEPEVFNTLVERSGALINKYKRFIILTGNHDITVEGHVFNTAHSLSNVLGRVQVISYPKFEEGIGVLIPFTKGDFLDEIEYVLANSGVTINKLKVDLFMHQSIIGAVYGRRLEDGVDPKSIASFRKIFCGHVHEPQVIGKVNIIGAPYQINFGDGRDRFIYYYDNVTGEIKKDTVFHPYFITVDSPEKIGAQDTVNFYRVLADSTVDDKYKKMPNVRIVVQPKLKKVVRVEAKTENELLAAYCKREKHPEMLEAGLRFLEGGV